MLTATRAFFAFSDGVEQEVSVPAGASLLDAALEAGLPLLHQCKSGSCSTCVATLVSGEADTLAGASSTLLASEKASGQRLLCVTEARGDCRFALGYDSKAGSNAPVKVHGFVEAIERIASDAVRLSLELAEGDWLSFRPGQFVQVKVPGSMEARSYSIASTVADLPRIDLLIRILPGGLMSRWLTETAKPDDVLELEGPFGSFFLGEKDKRPHIMIAGGTGLAPMMAMIDTIRGQSGQKPRILLSFGCASPEGLFYTEELDLRTHWLPHLDVRLSVDKGAAPPGVRTGNPVQAVDAASPDSVAYLCGPPGLIAAARAHLQGLGVDPANIHAEQFVASQ